jgi:peptidoglycan/LPS O-acetylase OafA/YrhL
MTQIVAPFDIINRWKSITVSKRPGALSGAFDLVRLISMGWVVMAHQFSMRSAASESTIDTYTPKMEQGSWNVTFIEHGFYAVDFFLFMGGYVAIISLKRLTTDFKDSPKWKLPVLYIFIVIKRYARILPMVAVITMFIVYVLPYITDRWPNNVQIQSGQEIPMYWGSWSLAYAWNIFGMFDNINAAWFWYLVVDFQCFLVVPILLMLLPIDKRLPIALSVGLVIASCTYGMWTSITFPIYGNISDINWALKYYFNVLPRACVYFMGVTVALVMLAPENKKPTRAPAVNNSTTVPQVSVGPNSDLGYEIRPAVTEHVKKQAQQKIESAQMTTWVVGGICLCLIILSACLMHYYFQMGYPKDYVKSPTLNALWLTFGKLVFVTTVMLLLISVCKTNENFPKMIANNATIQVIGNLSFSIYCWHYIVLTWVVQASETNGPISPYYYYGCFFWV